jgi:hypothetical protein
LQFDENGEVHSSDAPTMGKDRMSKSRSVFGVDQIWEKEMAKLKEMQEQEAREEKKRIEAAEEKTRRKAKGKGKWKEVEITPTDVEPSADPPFREGVVPIADDVSPVRPVSELPPLLQYSPDKAAIPKPSFLEPPQEQEQTRRSGSRLALGDWSDSSDDESGLPRRARKDRGKGSAKAGPSTPFQMSSQANHSPIKQEANSSSDSEEDIPLSRIAPVAGKVTLTRTPEEMDYQADSDEDVPLSKLAIRSPIKSSVSQSDFMPTAPNPTGGSLGLSLPRPEPPHIPNDLPEANQQPRNTGDDNDDDDDDVPLMVRRARAQTAASLEGHLKRPQGDDAEDDLPLGYKHAGAATRQASQGMPRHSDPRATMMSFQSGYGVPVPQPYPPMMGPMGWDPTGMGMMGGMNPYGGMPMGYPSMPSLPNLPMAFPGMPGVEGMMMGGQGMEGYGYGLPQERAIDDWRKGVAVAPASEAGPSGR